MDVPRTRRTVRLLSLIPFQPHSRHETDELVCHEKSSLEETREIFITLR